MADQKTGPQAFVSSYAPRLRTYVNSLMTPVLPSTATSGPISRTTKRGTTVINYAEENFDYDDDDSDDVRRRPTGLRSLRRDETTARADPSERVNKETSEPVDVPGIWRDWMSRDSLSKTQFKRSDIQNYAQAALPLTLIPIRIDLEIPAFVPPPSFPPPAHGADMSQPQYRSQEMTLPYRLKDTFLWNLHESLITTDQFAHTMVQDLDLPNKVQMAAEISKQIRTQLEEYAGVALHPLFHSPSSYADPAKQARAEAATPATPRPNDSGTPLPAANDGSDAQSRALGASSSSGVKNGVTAEAKAIPATGADADGTDSGPVDLEGLDPDDTYRCIVTLNITLASQLYTDRFEWSLLHPVGTAEAFAKQTCADLGLPAEWVPAITHAIYEAVLRLKKEACEAGGLVVGWGGGGAGGSG